ncbi:MAG: NADP(H)-dependent aldo-keto reductase [Rhodospirillales bacterium]|nr:MAG: NADP(H)-dependent aldo-keto reductase [Rhodospirillales bacterium]
MQYRSLGTTGIRVSRICLGTMTFGEQNTEAEAFRQLDMAVDAGVNFVDAAEMYPIPPRAATAGRTEEIIGAWLRHRGRRHDIVLATKITGPGEMVRHVRGGDLRYGQAQIDAAIEGSLRRLSVDHIDLYQLHWPERPANYFGRRGYRRPDAEAFTPFEEILEALATHVRAGTIRAIGLSNETAWGTMAFLRLADAGGLPRVAGIQNPYNLLNRLFEIGLAEVAIREKCGLLAYSPLAFGTLSGKYLNGARPPGARLTLFPHYTRYTAPNARRAAAAYVAVAARFGLDPAQMALAYVLSRPFLTSAIIGATTEAQLRMNLAAEDLALAPEVIAAIETVHDDNPNPAP